MNDIVKNMKQVNTIFKKHSVRLWLSWGTLLGAVREQKLIDDDIDLATIDLNHPSNWVLYYKVKDELKKEGYEIEEQQVGVNVKKDGFRAGIGFYKVGQIPQKPNVIYQENIPVMFHNKFFAKKFYYGIIKNSPNDLKYFFFRLLGGYYITTVIPSDIICPLREINFYNQKFAVPYDCDKYLEYLYGKDWKIPNPDFPHFVSKKNINYFKGTFDTIMVECPRCGNTFAETRKDQKKPVVRCKIHCGACGKNWYAKVFIKGVVQRWIK